MDTFEQIDTYQPDHSLSYCSYGDNEGQESDAESVSSAYHTSALINPDSFDQKYHRDRLHFDLEQKWQPNHPIPEWRPNSYYIWHTQSGIIDQPTASEYKNHELDPAQDGPYRHLQSRLDHQLAMHRGKLKGKEEAYRCEMINSKVRYECMEHLSDLHNDKIGQYRGVIHLPQLHLIYANNELPLKEVTDRFETMRMPSLRRDTNTGIYTLTHRKFPNRVRNQRNE